MIFFRKINYFKNLTLKVRCSVFHNSL